MTLDQSIPLNLDLLLQTMLSQLPLARLAQQTLSEITQFGFEAHLGSLAIEASRLVAVFSDYRRVGPIGDHLNGKS